MNFVGTATSSPSATLIWCNRPSQETARIVYLPGVSVGSITGVAVKPPGQSGPPPNAERPGGGVQVLSKCFLQICVPVSTSIAKRLSETPATTATCLGPEGVFTFSIISGGKRLCISRG